MTKAERFRKAWKIAKKESRKEKSSPRQWFGWALSEVFEIERQRKAIAFLNAQENAEMKMSKFRKLFPIKTIRRMENLHIMIEDGMAVSYTDSYTEIKFEFKMIHKNWVA